MPYFGVDSERYGGWTEEEKEEALKSSELPPGRGPGAPQNYGQTDIRRWIANIYQASRMFGHRDENPPEYPKKQIGEGVTDSELESELHELEDAINED